MRASIPTALLASHLAVAALPAGASEPEALRDAPSTRDALITQVVEAIAADDPKPILRLLLDRERLAASCPDTPEAALLELEERSARRADDILESLVECRALADFSEVRVVDLRGGGFSGHYDGGVCRHHPFYDMRDLRVLLEARDGSRVELRIDDPVTWTDTAFLITDDPRCKREDPAPVEEPAADDGAPQPFIP